MTHRAELIISANIRSIAVGGAGVGEVTSQSDGRFDLLGITAFVPFTAIGEQVTARVLNRKERYIDCQLLEITEQSSNRVQPHCKFFGICGGCELQHLSYTEQLKAKYEMISGALRAAKLPTTVLEKLSPIIPGNNYGYRRRLTLHVDSSGKIGLYREASRSVVALDSCPVTVPGISLLLANIQDFGRQIAGKISSILLEADDAGVVAVLKSPYDLAKTEISALMSVAKEHFTNALLLLGDKEVSGFGRQILELPLDERPTLTLRVPAGYFSQVNSQINRELVQHALRACGTVYNQKVYDLYAGAGNFSLPFARSGAKVTAVECDKRLVAFGRENAARYNLQKNLEFVESSVEKFLGKGQRPDPVEVIIADPPRSGLGNLIAQLPSAKLLVLVSCHLPSFVRDLKGLLDNSWELDTITPFDMFAQTSYVEVLSTFTK